MKLTIGKKLGIGFGIVTLLLVIVWFVGIFNVSYAVDVVEEAQESGLVLEGLRGTNENWLMETISIYNFFGTGLEEHLVQAEEFRAAAEDGWNVVVELRGDEYREEIQNASQSREEYYSLLNRAVTQFQKDPTNAGSAMAYIFAAGEYFHETAMPNLKVLHDLELAKTETQTFRVNANHLTLTITSVIAIFLAIVAAYVNTSGIVNATKHLSKAAESISRGDLDVPIEVNTGDEMEDLAKSLIRMRASLKLAVQRLRTKKTS